MKVFIDSDVILDVIQKREPFFRDSALVLDLAARGFINGVTSPVVITNVYYIARKPSSAMIQHLLKFLSVVPITHEMMVDAFASEYGDKEDAVQYFTALKAKARYLITRNTRDHEHARGIIVISPEDFVKLGSVKSKLKNR